MAIEVETKDTTALSDSELEEMANVCVDGPAGYDIGLISKQKDDWVLVTQARESGRLLAWSYCTLERIGGTPCLLWGMATVKRHSKRDAAMKAMIHDQFRRAVMAFPDEDVVVGARFIDPSGYLAFSGLQDIVPRDGHKPTGEERAWSRRLAKRFGADGQVDDRTFVVKGDGNACGVFDYETLRTDKIDPTVVPYFEKLNPQRHDSLIVFGWAMAEDLAAEKLPR